MKRHQIRRLIPSPVSDAQIRRAIADLGLPADDTHDYSDDQAKQILNQFSGHPTAGKGDRHTQTTQTAHTSGIQDQTSLADRTQQQLARIQTSLNQIATDRSTAVEQVSDTLAYLYSPQTFHADVLSRTAEKLGLKQSDPEPETLTLDTLGDCFSRFADTVGYPAIAASSALGCLPM